MIAIRYENQDANLCSFRTVMKPIRYSINMKLEVLYKSWKIESTFRLT